MLAAHRGEETAEVISAVPLDEAAAGQHPRTRSPRYAGRPVQLTAAVDPACSAGSSCASARA